MSNQRGFTLIEVLVALAILAVAMSALLRASSVAVDNSESMRQRMIATWLAENRIETIKATYTWPSVGALVGEVSQAQSNLPFRYEQIVTATPNPNFRKVQVNILSASQQKYVLASLTAYLQKPNTRGGF